MKKKYIPSEHKYMRVLDGDSAFMESTWKALLEIAPFYVNDTSNTIIVYKQDQLYDIEELASLRELMIERQCEMLEIHF
jgi:hypothetical protein